MHILPGETEVFFVLLCQEEEVQSLGERVDQETLDSSMLGNTLIANLSSLNVLIEGNMRHCAIYIFIYVVLANIKQFYNTWIKLYVNFLKSLSGTCLTGTNSFLNEIGLYMSKHDQN